MVSILKHLKNKPKIAINGYRLLREDKDGYWFIDADDHVLLVGKYEATYTEFTFINLMLEVTEGLLSTEDLRAIHAQIH
jgi:hypothetical protein